MYPIDTQDGLFHDGDGVSELGTVLPASWLNQIQQELIAILKDAGINPDKNNVNQVVAAIKIIIQKNKAFSASIADIAKLAEKITARKIGNVSFDGSQDIDLPGVNKPGNQDTTGNAATATKLQNAVNINGIPFNGSKDINVTPSGAVQFFAMETAPVGWLKANGAAISRITYANLYAAIGTRFGAGDGKITFNLPDLRGEFLRSFDDGRGVDIDRTLGDYQEDSLKSHNHCLSTFKPVNGSIYKPISKGAELSSVGVGDDVITSNTGESETRPRNIALLACIKI